MATPGCTVCGAEIPGAHPSRKYCDACRRETKRQAARKYYKHTPVAGTKDLICEGCQRVWHSRNNRGQWCPECRAARAKQQIADYARRPEVKERRAAASRERGDSRRSTLRTYGLTEETYAAMYEAQDGKCAICGTPHPVLCVDHDHGSDRVRGLLCRACNRSIGQLGDTAEALQRAADYLRGAEDAARLIDNPATEIPAEPLGPGERRTSGPLDPEILAALTRAEAHRAAARRRAELAEEHEGWKSL